MSLTEVLAGSGLVVIGLVQLVKSLGLPSFWSPLVALLLGIGCVTLFVNIGATHFIFNSQVVWFGLIAGLTAAGFYSGTTSTVSTLKARAAFKKATAAGYEGNIAQ